MAALLTRSLGMLILKATLTGLEGQQANRRIDRLLDDLLRCAGRHLLDLRPALFRGHQGDPAGGAIDHHADIVFLLNLAPLFDQEALHFLPFGARLMGDQHFPQELFGVGAHFVQAAGELDAPRLSPSAGVNLRLDNPQIPAQSLRRLHRFFGGEGHLSPGHVHPVLFQYLFSLVLVNIHASPASYPQFPPQKKKPGRFLLTRRAPCSGPSPDHRRPRKAAWERLRIPKARSSLRDHANRQIADRS